MSAVSSQALQSIRHFPQELIDNIVDELLCDNGDHHTMAQCLTVSRSFRASTHRHLYAFIDLTTIQRVVLLHGLLMEMPDIAGNIRWVHMRVGGDEEGKIDDEVVEWLASDTLLADIFNMLPYPKALIWGIWRRIDRNWNDLSSELQSAVVNLFQRPSLTIIAIASLTNFPLSTLHAVPQVKELYLYSVRMQNEDHKQIVIPHLEVLRIVQHYWRDPEVQLVTPNLRKLSFDDLGQSCTLAQQALETSMTSLEQLWLLWAHRPRPACA